MIESRAHCVVYSDRALAITVLDPETDNMQSHAANFASAAGAVVRAAGRCANDENETREHLAALLVAAEMLGALSQVCSEEAARNTLRNAP
ncbi:hypothetical protein [Thermomonas fusca]